MATVNSLLQAFALRPAVASDRNYICDSFRRYLAWDTCVLDCLSGSIGDHVAELDRLLRAPFAQTIVASLPTQPDRVFGWACAVDGSLWFAYVGKDYRKWGLGSQMATKLVGGVPMPLVYWTHHAEKIQRERGYPLTWDWRAFQAVNRRHHRPQIKGAA